VSGAVPPPGTPAQLAGLSNRIRYGRLWTGAACAGSDWRSVQFSAGIVRQWVGYGGDAALGLRSSSTMFCYYAWPTTANRTPRLTFFEIALIRADEMSPATCCIAALMRYMRM